MRGVRWIHCLRALGKTRIKLIQKQEKSPRAWSDAESVCCLESYLQDCLVAKTGNLTWIFTSTDNKHSSMVCLWALKVTLHISTLFKCWSQIIQRRRFYFQVLQESFIAAPKELTTLSIVPDYQEHCKNSSCIAEHSQFSRPDILRVPMLSFLLQIETEGWTTCEQGFKCVVEGCCFSGYW